MATYSDDELEMMDAISEENFQKVKEFVKKVNINKVYFRPDGKPYTFLDLALDHCLYAGHLSQYPLIVNEVVINGGVTYRDLKRASMKQEEEPKPKPKLNTSRVKTNGIASLPRRTSMFLGNVIKNGKSRKSRKGRKSRKNN